jgi:hypothetical protein
MGESSKSLHIFLLDKNHLLTKHPFFFLVGTPLQRTVHSGKNLQCMSEQIDRGQGHHLNLLVLFKLTKTTENHPIINLKGEKC